MCSSMELSSRRRRAATARGGQEIEGTIEGGEEVDRGTCA